MLVQSSLGHPGRPTPISGRVLMRPSEYLLLGALERLGMYHFVEIVLTLLSFKHILRFEIGSIEGTTVAKLLPQTNRN